MGCVVSCREDTGDRVGCGFMGVCAGKILVSGVWLHGWEDTGEWVVASWGSVLGRYW